MAEKEQKLPNPDMYRHAKAGAQFLQAKDVASAGKCLEQLASEMKVSEENKPFLIWNATANDPSSQMRQYGMAKGLEIGVGKYEEEIGKLTVSQMFERYSTEFDKYLGEEEREKAKSAFEKLGGKTYSSISEQVAQLQEIMGSKTDRWSEEDKAKAEKEYTEKYANVVETIQEFEGVRIGKLMNPMQEESVKSNVKERFKVEKKENK